MIEGRATIADVMQTGPEFETLQVVPASIDLSGADLELADMPDRNNLMRNALDAFLEQTSVRDAAGGAGLDRPFRRRP